MAAPVRRRALTAVGGAHQTLSGAMSAETAVAAPAPAPLTPVAAAVPTLDHTTVVVVPRTRAATRWVLTSLEQT